MGIQSIGGSSGLTTSDLITQPQWTLLGSYTTSGQTASITISSIPSTYRTLRLIVPQCQPSAQGYALMRFNGTGGTVYQRFGFYEHSNFEAAMFQGGTGYFYINNYNTTANYGFVLDVENYSSTTDYKYIKGEMYHDTSSGGAKEEVKGVVGITSAITSVTLQHSNGNVNVSPIGSSIPGAGFLVYGAK